MSFVAAVPLAGPSVSSGAISPPTDLRATAVSSSQIDLNWTDNSNNELRFKVYRATSDVGPWIGLGSVESNVVTFADAGLAAGETYYYRVRGVNAAGHSHYTNIASDSTQDQLSPPVAPANLLASAISASRIVLSWTDRSNNETGFRIERAPATTGPWTQLAQVGAGITAFQDTGLSTNTLYAFRVLASNLFGDSGYSNIASTQTADGSLKIAKGIYLLDNRRGNDRLASLQYADKPWIDGWVWRMGWRDFDQGTNAPLYDFSSVTTAIVNLQRMNKKLSLQLDVQEVPDYVLASAQDTYVATVKQLDTIYQTLTPTPWDAPSLVHYKNFLAAFGNHRVFDSVSQTKVPLRDHPTLGPMRISVIGRDHVARNLYGDLTTISSYTRANYIQAVTNCLCAVQDQFPSKPLHVGYFSIKDNNRSPSLDSALLAAIARAFDGVNRPHIGLFEELLTGVKPNPTGIYAGNLQTGRANGSPITFQALGDWRDKDRGQWTPEDNSPENGFRHGYDNFGAVYFEMYLVDLSHPPFQAVFETWQAFLASLPD